MAARYWVGGSAAWDGTAGTKWALTDGGAGGQAVPTSADDVYFTAASGANTVTVTGTQSCNNLTCTGFTGTLTGASTPNLQIYGNMTLVAGMTLNSAITNITFRATSTGKTITTAGKNLNYLTFNGVGGSWTQLDALLCAEMYINNGTYNTGNFNVTTNCFKSIQANARTINLGSSTVTISGGGDFGQQSLALVSTNLTFNAGTSQINITLNGNNKFEGGGVTFYNVSIIVSSSDGTCAISGANTFNNLSIGTSNSGNYETIYNLSANQVVNGTLTLSNNGTYNRRTLIQSNTLGTQRTFKIAALTAGTFADFQDIAVDQTGTVKTITGTSIGDCGGNSNITFTSPKTVYWNLTGSQGWMANGWASTSGGSPATSNYPLPQDTAIFNNAGAATTVNIGYGNSILSNIDMSARTNAMTISSDNSGQIYALGSLTLGSGVTCSAGNFSWKFINRGTTQTITSNGVSLGFAVVVNNIGGTVQLGDALTISSSTTGGGIYLTNGTFNAANYNVTVPNTQLQAGTKTLTMGSGTWTLSGTGTVWNMNTNSSGLTFSGASSTINLTDTSTTARTFTGGSQTYGTLNILGTTGESILTINSANVFDNIYSERKVFNSIVFGANQTVNKWNITGNATPYTNVNTIFTVTDSDNANTNVDTNCFKYFVAQSNIASGTRLNFRVSGTGSATDPSGKLPSHIYVFRPNTTPTNITINSLNQEGNIGTFSRPVPQTITSGSATSPCIAFAMYKLCGGTTFTSRTFSPSPDVELGSGDTFSAYKIYNSSPSDITVSMVESSTSTAAAMASFYMQVDGVTSITAVGNTTNGLMPSGIQAGDIIVMYLKPGNGNATSPISIESLPSNTTGIYGSGFSIAVNTKSTVDYLFLDNLTCTTTTPCTFWVGKNSTTLTNTANIPFDDGINNRVYILTSGTSFTTPADWNNSNNTIHLFGGGGGGAGGRYTSPNGAGGAGGGGGGYTKLTNQTLSGTISYAIGAGGTAGTAAGNGGAGGTTTWNVSYTAGGGGRGTGTTTSSTGGTAGVGSTYNGGVGGQGSLTTVSAQAANGAGGGAGAGGPNGNGANGGNGFAGGATAANTGGGGGGGNGGGSAGDNATSATGGSGGNNSGSTGGGTAATSGTLGGGGGGASGTTPTVGSGGSGYDILGSFGSSGGSGGGGTAAPSPTTNAGLYGGGGGGGGVHAAGTQRQGIAGSQGAIIIVYSASAPTQSLTPSLFTNTNGFFSPSVSSSKSLSPSIVNNTNTFLSEIIRATYAISANRFDNENAFNTNSVSTTYALSANLYSNTNSFYAHNANYTNSINVDLFNNSSAYYSASITTNNALIADEYVNESFIYSHIVYTNSYVISPALVSNSQEYYEQSIHASYSINPNVYENSQEFYSSELSSSYALNADIVENSQQFFDAQLFIGEINLQPSEFNNINEFFSGSVYTTYQLYMDAFYNENTFYQHSIAIGLIKIIPSLYSNENSFYEQTLTLGPAPQIISPDEYVNEQVFNTQLVSYTYSLTAGIYTNVSTFNQVDISATYSLSVNRYENTQSFYDVSVDIGPITLRPSVVINNNEFYNFSTEYVVYASLLTNANNFYSQVLTNINHVYVDRYNNENTFFSEESDATIKLHPQLFINENVFINGHLININYVSVGRLNNVNAFYTAKVFEPFIRLASRAHEKNVSTSRRNNVSYSKRRANLAR